MVNVTLPTREDYPSTASHSADGPSTAFLLTSVAYASLSIASEDGVVTQEGSLSSTTAVPVQQQATSSAISRTRVYEGIEILMIMLAIYMVLLNC